MEKPEKKRIGRTTFYYWDIKDLLRRMYAHPELAADMLAHAKHVPTEDEMQYMRREKYPNFFKDPGNVVLLGCADGATVWKDLRGVFPVTFQYLNLHPAIRGKFVNMELWGICNGTKPKSTQPIYELFVDQLLELWE
eukprot:gene33007-42137_t